MSTYCLDLMSETDMMATLDKAEACLHPERGLLLLAGITWGYRMSVRTFLMTLVWEILYRFRRKVVYPNPNSKPNPNANANAKPKPKPNPNPTPNPTPNASGARSSAAVGRSTWRPTCAPRDGALSRRCAPYPRGSHGWRPRCWPRGRRSQSKAGACEP